MVERSKLFPRISRSRLFFVRAVARPRQACPGTTRAFFLGTAGRGLRTLCAGRGSPGGGTFSVSNFPALADCRPGDFLLRMAHVSGCAFPLGIPDLDDSHP